MERELLNEYLNTPSIKTGKELSANTKTSYLRFYNKILKNSKEKDFLGLSQKALLHYADQESKTNSAQGIINIGIIVRRLHKLNVDDLENARSGNKKRIIQDIKVANHSLELPSYDELIDFLDYLYKSNLWIDFIINYLLIYFQVRNADLNFKIIEKLRDATEKHTNYLWVSPTKIMLIRRDYKTVNTYDEKQNVINSPEFRVAIKRIMARGDEFIANKDYIGYYIKKATLKGIGEGAYLKIVIDHFRGDLQKLKEISYHRGTDIKTLISNYDINNV